MKKRRSSFYAHDAMAAFIMLLPYALMFSLFIAVPVAIAVALSLTYFNAIQFPVFAGLANYVTILTQDDVFFKYVLPNTLKYSIIVGPGGYLLSFILAWMLAQIQSLPRTLIALALYMPSLAGGVFISVIWRTIFSGSQNGFLNAWLITNGFINQPIQFLQSPEFLLNIMIIVSLWSAMGIGFLAMLAGILNINEELFEAAYIDGMRNRFQEIIYITIPSMKPQMLFGAVMSIVSSFSNARIGVELAGGNPTPQYSGQLIINHIEDYGFQRYEMGYASALALMALLLVWGFSKVAYKLFDAKDE